MTNRTRIAILAAVLFAFAIAIGIKIDRTLDRHNSFPDCQTFQ